MYGNGSKLQTHVCPPCTLTYIPYLVNCLSHSFSDCLATSDNNIPSIVQYNISKKMKRFSRRDATNLPGSVLSMALYLWRQW